MAERRDPTRFRRHCGENVIDAPSAGRAFLLS